MVLWILSAFLLKPWIKADFQFTTKLEGGYLISGAIFDGTLRCIVNFLPVAARCLVAYFINLVVKIVGEREKGKT